MVVLLGPTASGKTALGVELALKLGCRVLSVDSRQIYQHMDVGTAKPSAAERAGVTHELLDLVPPNQPLNLQQFCELAQPLISAELGRGDKNGGGVGPFSKARGNCGSTGDPSLYALAAAIAARASLRAVCGFSQSGLWRFLNQVRCLLANCQVRLAVSACASSRFRSPPSNATASA